MFYFGTSPSTGSHHILWVKVCNPEKDAVSRPKQRRAVVEQAASFRDCVVIVVRSTGED